MINAIATMEGDNSILEMPDEDRFVSLEQRGISAEEAARYVEDMSNNGINDDVTTGSFDMEGFDENAVTNDAEYDTQYSSFDGIDLEGFFGGSNFDVFADIEKYTIEEGNAQLDDPMCKK